MRRTPFLAAALLAGSLVVAFPGPASAQSPITNGSFETGDLTGWSTTIPAGAYVNVLPGGAPGQGSFFAELKTNGPGSTTMLEQSFSGTGGDAVTGWANYIDTEAAGGQPCIFTDPATVSILDAANTVIATPFAAQHCSSLGYDGSTGWVQWSFVLPATGTYTVKYQVENTLDSIFDGLLQADGVAYDDNTPPTVSCVLGVNPAGKSVADANAGFRQVLGADNVELASLVITDGTFTSGPLASGDYVKLTVDPTSAGSDVRPGPGVLAAHITTSGQPMLVATDWQGNTASVPCGPLPPLNA